MAPRSSRWPVAVALLAALWFLPAHAEPLQLDDLWRGVQAFREGDYTRAITLFTQYRQQHPDADLSVYLGPAYYKVGAYDQARRELVKGFRRGDQDPVATYYLGLTYYHLGFVALSARAFEAVLQQQPGYKLSYGARRHLESIDRETAALSAEAILAFAETLQQTAPDLALDYASEALLRSGSKPVAPRLRALLTRIVDTQLPTYRQWVASLESAPSGHAVTAQP